jgi:hypothetical protein
MAWPRSVWLPASLGAASWVFALAGGMSGWMSPTVGGAVFMAGGFWVLDVAVVIRALSMAMLSPAQHEFAERTYLGREMRVPRYRFGLGISLLAPALCLLSRSEVFRVVVLVGWGIGCTGWMIWDLMRAYYRARVLPAEVA